MMRFVNPNLYLALLFCLVLFISGRQLAILRCDSRTKWMLTIILSAVAFPALLFPLGYFDLFGESPFYCSFRTINRIEILTSLLSPLLGYISYDMPQRRRRRVRESGLPALAMRLRPFAFPFCILYITLCFIKPIIRPLSRNIDFSERWEDGVMMQSSASTCGPASLATAMFSIDGYMDSEADIAKRAFTCSSGTENWYLARHTIERGYRVRFSKCRDIEDVAVPSIIGVRIGDIGHFITVLGVGDNSVVIGDPLRGRLSLTPEEFYTVYDFPGFTMAVSSRTSR